MFSEKIGTANFYLLSPSSLVQFTPDKHHLDYLGSWSNESSRRNQAEKLANFAGCQLLYTTLNILKKTVSFCFLIPWKKLLMMNNITGEHRALPEDTLTKKQASFPLSAQLHCIRITDFPNLPEAYPFPGEPSYIGSYMVRVSTVPHPNPNDWVRHPMTITAVGFKVLKVYGHLLQDKTT